MSTGIDYGMGLTNIDRETGIRYGVISQHEVLQAWSDSSEANYGNPTCPKCGNDAETYDDLQHADWKDGHSCCDYACEVCKYVFDSEEAYGDEPYSYILDSDGYKAECGPDGDIFIFKSPFYTRCEFCSPCAPGAGYIMNSVEDGVKAYCFGHDWFEHGVAPYQVYQVADDRLVSPESRPNENWAVDR